MKTLNKILIIVQLLSIIFIFYCLIFISKISTLPTYFFIVPLGILLIRLSINKNKAAQEYTYQMLLMKFINILSIFIAAVALISKLLVFMMFASLDGS